MCVSCACCVFVFVNFVWYNVLFVRVVCVCACGVCVYVFVFVCMFGCVYI